MKKYIIWIVFLLVLPLKIIFAQSTKDTVYTIFYTTNQWKLDAEKIVFLKTMLPKIIAIKRIEAFADSVGSIQNNYKLSRKRGAAIENYVAKNQLKPMEQPVFWGEKNTAQMPLFNNRRVDIYCLINDVATDANIAAPKEIFVQKDSVVIELENIFFVADRAFVEANSVKYLESLVDTLVKYNAKKIEIVGYSNKGTAHYYLLSEQRAKAIYNFLKSKGFDEKSMSYMGLGDSRKLFENPKSFAEMRKNMRVEVILKF